MTTRHLVALALLNDGLGLALLLLGDAEFAALGAGFGAGVAFRARINEGDQPCAPTPSSTA